MKWIHTISSLDPREGGPSVVVLELSTALALNGHDVQVITMRTRDTPHHPLYEAAVRAGVEIVTVPTVRLSKLRLSIRFCFAHLRRARNADVLVAHGFYQAPSIVTGVASVLWRKPAILQPHGVFEAYQESRGSFFKPLFTRILGHRLLRVYRRTIAASPGEKIGIIAKGVSQNTITVIGFGIPKGRNRATVDNMFNSRRVLFLSRIAPKKRLDLLIEAVNLLNDDEPDSCYLTICGDGPTEYVTELKALVRHPHQVQWLGHVEGGVRASVESEHSLFCLPTDNENYGLSITEAMAVGLPVLTTAAAGAASHVTAAGAGLVLNDPTAMDLADAIEVMLDRPVELSALGKRGAAYASTELSWRHVADRWADLAESIVSS